MYYKAQIVHNMLFQWGRKEHYVQSNVLFLYSSTLVASELDGESGKKDMTVEISTYVYVGMQIRVFMFVGKKKVFGCFTENGERESDDALDRVHYATSEARPENPSQT